MFYFGGTSKQPPLRTQPSRRAKPAPPASASELKSKKTERQQYTPAKPGQVERSRNRQLAGTGDAYKNELAVLAYQDSLGTDRYIQQMAQQIPDMRIGNITGTKSENFAVQPGNLGFVFYDEPNRDPSDANYTPSVTSREEALDVFYFTPTEPFTDRKRHQCLGVLYNRRRLKIKKAGLNLETGMPFLYVEDPVINTFGVLEQTRWYGTFTIKENAGGGAVGGGAAGGPAPTDEPELEDFDDDEELNFELEDFDENAFGKRRTKRSGGGDKSLKLLKSMLKEISYLKKLKC